MVRKNARGKPGMQECKSARKRKGSPQSIFSHASDFLLHPSSLEAVDCSNSNYLAYMSFIQCID